MRVVAVSIKQEYLINSSQLNLNLYNELLLHCNTKCIISIV